MYKKIKKMLPGIIVSLIISIISLLMHNLPIWPFTIAGGHHPFEAMTIAIILGIMTNNYFYKSPKFIEGIHFCSKYILYTAIVFLGVKLNLLTILHISWQVIIVIVVCLLFSYFLSKKIGKIVGLKKNMSTLIAFGTAVCGGSAIAAIAPVIKAEKPDTAISIAIINIFGTLALFIFPLIGHLLKMSIIHFSVWAGTSIQAVPQVVAACFSFNLKSGLLGTTVKLVRVLFLAPMLFLVSKTSRVGDDAQSLPWTKAIPPFILLFCLVVILSSFQFQGDAFINHLVTKTKYVLSFTSNYLMVVAMAAIGMQVSFSNISTSVSKPLCVAGVSFIILSAFSYVIITLFL
jgi:uncharacterized integral membrane protein (TIGR00698 family)